MDLKVCLQANATWSVVRLGTSPSWGSGASRCRCVLRNRPRQDS